MTRFMDGYMQLAHQAMDELHEHNEILPKTKLKLKHYITNIITEEETEDEYAGTKDKDGEHGS